MTFCLPVAYYKEHLARKEREEKGLAEPLLAVGGGWLACTPQTRVQLHARVAACTVCSGRTVM